MNTASRRVLKPQCYHCYVHHIERRSSRAAIEPSHCGEKEKKTAAKLARQPLAGDQAANYKVEHLKSEEGGITTKLDLLIKNKDTEFWYHTYSSNHGR